MLVDATHPFAARITEHAVAAAAELRLPLLLLRRPGWGEGPGDRWHRVPDAAAAAALLPGLGERVFLATGRGDLPTFARLDLWFLLRAVEPPPPPLPARCRCCSPADRSRSGERELLARHRIEVLVARDSGGAAAAGQADRGPGAGPAGGAAGPPRAPPGRPHRPHRHRRPQLAHPPPPPSPLRPSPQSGAVNADCNLWISRLTHPG